MCVHGRCEYVLCAMMRVHAMCVACVCVVTMACVLCVEHALYTRADGEYACAHVFRGMWVCMCVCTCVLCMCVCMCVCRCVCVQV